MHEKTLKNYLIGSVDVQTLITEINSSIITNKTSTGYKIIDMEDSFVVTSEHLSKIIDDALSNLLSSTHLKAIGFCLEASECFEWPSESSEAEKVSKIVSFLCSPEINYELNESNLKMFKNILLK